MDFIEPTVFSSQVAKPTDELVIQKSLKAAGYSEEDVVSITPINQPAKEYLVSGWSGRYQKKRQQLMNTIVDGLKNNLVYHDIKITMGDIVEALQTQDVKDASI